MGLGDLNMAVGVLFILACASLYGFAMFLFRDQMWPEKTKSSIGHL
jgi:hypothetical protein